MNNILNGHRIFLRLLGRIAAMLILFQVARLAFFLFNRSTFDTVGFSDYLLMMYGGLRFDVSALLYTNSLFILLMLVPLKVRYNAIYLRFTDVLFVITNSIVLIANVMDIFYFPYTLRRTTADVFLEFASEQHLTKLLFTFAADYWQGTVLSILFIGTVLFLFLKKYKHTGLTVRGGWGYYLSGVVLMALSLGLVLAGLRGGFRHSTRPITLSNAGAYVSSPKEMAIVLNTPFAIFRTLGKPAFTKKAFYPEKELDAIFSPWHAIPDSAASFKQKNVVVIILESFGKEYTGFFNKDIPNYDGYTPFLDSLMEQGLTWKYSVANGRKSIDALPSVVSSVPSVKVPYILSSYSSNELGGLASALKQKDYHTSFFHGAPNGSMGFDSFVKMVGFENYYGMSEYDNNDDFDGYWGIWDHLFLDYMAEQLNTFPKPFFSTVFTLSSHHPFLVHDDFKGKLKTGKLNQHKVVNYTDKALRMFFDKIKKYSWYENTLFVISADHASVADLPQYKGSYGNFAIPIVFYTPSGELKGHRNEPIQQIDIMPSVLGHLNYDLPFLSFGNDLVTDSTDNHMAVNFYAENFQVFYKDKVLLTDGEKVNGVFDLSKDMAMRKSIQGSNPEQEEKMFEYGKAFIQQFYNRVIEDKLTKK